MAILLTERERRERYRQKRILWIGFDTLIAAIAAVVTPYLVQSLIHGLGYRSVHSFHARPYSPTRPPVRKQNLEDCPSFGKSLVRQTSDATARAEHAQTLPTRYPHGFVLWPESWPTAL